MSVSLITGSSTIPFDAIGVFADQNKTVGLERPGFAPETDFYIFSLADTQTITINVSDISANGDADLQLFTYTDVDGDGPVSSFDSISLDPDDLLGLLATSFTPGEADETISVTLTAGTYAVQVSRADASVQPRFAYDISMTATPVMTIPDPTPDPNPIPSPFSYVDALLYGDGNKWGNSQPNNPNATTVITYSFWSDASLDNFFYDTDTVDTPWFDYEMDAVQTALDMWADVANVEFVQVTDNNASANLKFALVNDDEIGADVLGSTSPPQFFGEGMTYLNWQGSGWHMSGLQPGGTGFITVLHSVGQALGLAHPHSDAGGSSIFPGVEPNDPSNVGIDGGLYTTGLFGLNQGVWTTMSFNDGWDQDDTTRLVDYGFQGSPMTFDIAAVQALYGINPTHNNGDDIYQLPNENGAGTYYMAIWDTGGEDTISAIASLNPVTIDLNDAPLTGPNAGGYISSVEGVYGGFTIANGVVIENAVGGAGDDLLIGNEADNVMTGLGGDDTILGDGGDDILGGDDGNDTISGGSGEDSLLGADGDDFLDGWTGDDLLFGDEGDDTLLGFDGDDSLYGGQGSDQLLGEAGSDVLVGYDGGLEEYDVLVGDLNTSEPDQMDVTDGGDRFILGDSTLGAYYLGLGFATIVDFYWLEGDRIQVYGSSNNYSLDMTQDWSGGSALDTVILYQNDVIGVVEDTTDVLLSQDFDFVA